MTKLKNKINNIKKKNCVFIIILVLFGLIATIHNWYILREDQIPLVWDAKDIFRLSQYYSNVLEKKGVISFTKVFFTEYWKDYPPMLVFQTMPIFFLFKGNLSFLEDVAVITQSFHLFILIISTYFLGKKTHSEELGFFAAVSTLLIPSTLSYSKIFLPVLPLTAYFISSITLFLYSDTFKKKNISVFFGISLGLGMISKYTFPVYIVLFFLSYSIFNLEKFRKIGKKQKKNVFISLLIPLFFILLWYPFHANMYVREAIVMTNKFLVNQFEHGSLRRIIESYNHYSSEIINKLLYSSVLFFILLISLFMLPIINYIKKKKSTFPYVFSTLSLFFFILITILFNSERFIFPMLPIFILIACNLILEIFETVHIFEKKSSPKITLLLILLLILGSHYMTLFKTQKNKEIIFTDRMKEDFIVARNYSRIDKKILGIIIENSEDISGDKSVLILVDSIPMDLLYTETELNESLSDYHINPLIFCISVPSVFDGTNGRECLYNKSLDYLCEYDFVIISDNMTRFPLYTMLEDYEEREELVRDIIKTWNSCIEDYEKIGSYWGEQNNNYIQYELYKKKKEKIR